jgi:L-threonylcarbamoyladenylate synthase
MALSEPAERLAACIRSGGVALFGADTVYGLACDPEVAEAVDRLHALKGHPPRRPSAVMFFETEPALSLLGPRTAEAVRGLLPGGVTLLIPNPDRRYPLACGDDLSTLGLRVPDLPVLSGAPPVLQSSANLTGEEDPRRLSDVPAPLREGVDLVLDAGEVPGTPSTVIDLRSYEADGTWGIRRAGAIGHEDVARALG